MTATAEMIEVTRDDFFAFIEAATFDIRTSHNDPTFTVWETVDRRPIGRSYPGWKNPGDSKAFYLTRAAISKAEG